MKRLKNALVMWLAIKCANHVGCVVSRIMYVDGAMYIVCSDGSYRKLNKGVV